MRQSGDAAHGDHGEDDGGNEDVEAGVDLHVGDERQLDHHHQHGGDEDVEHRPASDRLDPAEQAAHPGIVDAQPGPGEPGDGELADRQHHGEQHDDQEERAVAALHQAHGPGQDRDPAVEPHHGAHGHNTHP